MGYYVNPPGVPKEEWLLSHGKAAQAIAPDGPPPEGRAWVCIVNNGAFTAAGVVYSQGELEAFSEPGDRRPKMWVQVPKDDLTIEVVGDEIPFAEGF